LKDSGLPKTLQEHGQRLFNEGAGHAMSVYHQMGHDSKNLLCVPELNRFKGAIISPVNYSESDVVSQISLVREKPNFEMIFDPQMYYPKSKSDQLRLWDYFPNCADTNNIQSDQWWRRVVDKIALTCSRINPTAACSPAFAAKTYTNEYFKAVIHVGNYFVNTFSGTKIKPIQTVVCGISDLSTSKRVLEIASIISQTKAMSIYLVIVNNVVPRRELNEIEELGGVMRLISLLEQAGLPVIVGFTSSDMVLWKAAGASACATGKFFNLRRFSGLRFEEPSGGGGQIPYWFEESLMAYLRESDVIRGRKAGILSEASQANPFGRNILELMDKNPGKPWLAISWRQYLYAFADLENRIDSKLVDVGKLLKDAESNWMILGDKVLMEEKKNNGDWVRNWRRCLVEYQQGYRNSSR
jgi:hypothetical protein